MNIYKGLLMLQGYLTTVDPEDSERDPQARAPECRPTPGDPAATLRHGRHTETQAVPLGDAAGCLAGGCG
ncbi:hypothetical protein HPC49_30515 [Pyxidicoccus fallax]|uniref:Uncharacterized protein n=1 Tax=Pyxidicoccus fallax TaxID=394095 RepID=A0A848LF39_9BACT|nr:hypothetical protein [Pyxidicoccus fallax]NMO15553.1 hypothetical protein [Pyxidicoccus fallax]NPC82543.1 hypothetical protein [Pyxidicoccus fallax]